MVQNTYSIDSTLGIVHVSSKKPWGEENGVPRYIAAETSRARLSVSREYVPFASASWTIVVTTECSNEPSRYHCRKVSDTLDLNISEPVCHAPF